MRGRKNFSLAISMFLYPGHSTIGAIILLVRKKYEVTDWFSALMINLIRNAVYGEEGFAIQLLRLPVEKKLSSCNAFYPRGVRLKKRMGNFTKILSLIGLVLLAASCEKVSPGGAGRSADSFTGSMAVSGPGANGGGGGSNAAGIITAGEWNDLDHWDFWTGLMDTVKWKEMQDYWQLYPVSRLSVKLSDQDNNKISDAAISITSGTATYIVKTDNFGKAECFPGFFTGDASGMYSISASVNGQSFDLGTFSKSVHEIDKQLNINAPNYRNVDIMFVVDATGSMGDEIHYLQNELDNVILRSASELPKMQLREGSVFYRDKGDDYLTRVFPFTTDVNSLTTFVKAQQADGGGDFPESMELGLKAAIEQQNWSSTAICRLLFLVLDAPPHHEDQVIQSLQSTIKEAREKGIKIIPVTASGIDKETEFLMRFMAIGTNGTYVFITDDSGIGDSHLVPTVGSYQVEFLNNLMVRLIKKYATR